ncbi:MAG TPA: hypothetical protein DHV85_17440 [Candidatus Accumulibacter sp.]|nr:hypothetical protein [Accumulibacter sp.]
MRRSATRQGLSQEARAPVDKCADYRLKNKHKQRFDHANGWPTAGRLSPLASLAFCPRPRMCDDKR